MVRSGFLGTVRRLVVEPDLGDLCTALASRPLARVDALQGRRR
jgi:hypothetical protein